MLRIKKLDIYIIKKFLGTFFFIIILFIFIAVVFDFSEKIDDFLKHDTPLHAIIFEYYLNFIPYFMNLFSALFIYISAVYFTSRMAYNTEFVAILSSGTNFYRLLVPYMFVALILAAISFYLNGWVIPEGNKSLVDFESKYVNDPYLNSERNIHRQIAPGKFIFIRNFNNRNNTGNRFSLEKFDGEELKFKLLANKVEWVDSLQKWVVHRYQSRTYQGDKEFLDKGDTLLLDLGITPDYFGKKTASIATFNTPDLNQFIDEELLRGDKDVVYYQVEKYKRYSMPFSTFILVIIAFSLSSKRIRGGTGLHLGIGLVIAFGYILFLQFSTMFAIKSDLNPMLATWIPNIIFAGVAGVTLYLAKK